jgi:hypothetical protein
MVRTNRGAVSTLRDVCHARYRKSPISCPGSKHRNQRICRSLRKDFAENGYFCADGDHGRDSMDFGTHFLYALWRLACLPQHPDLRCSGPRYAVISHRSAIHGAFALTQYAITVAMNRVVIKSMSVLNDSLESTEQAGWKPALQIANMILINRAACRLMR